MRAPPARPIEALLAGAAVPVASLDGQPLLSAIGKRARAGALWLSRTGLEGDEQGDRVYHGGPDKALHHYAAEHYVLWRQWVPGSAVALGPGAFGENISTHGMSEREVHVGDVFRAGATLLQVTQARQPCFKLNLRLGAHGVARRMQDSGRTGWYYRVLREGWLAAGDVLELVDRPQPDWPLARLIAALYPQDTGAPWLPEEWHRASALPELAQRWRDTFDRRLLTGSIEDWRMRLEGPPGLGA
ncbi:MOSC domain-containing protein [Massilia sp. KIM]|uniref:MOSC domain-containing protein n=1 Tax=Massilia sp. KIM TaxID=1955422 RepID=UPI00098F2CD0|nr:MOSC domain-containing protein [Massilia sp. KIM]OON63525.1 MOSC domain-containing protein [Massilia sp. KIM]